MIESFIFEKPKEYSESNWEALCQALEDYISSWDDYNGDEENGEQE